MAETLGHGVDKSFGYGAVLFSQVAGALAGLVPSLWLSHIRLAEEMQGVDQGFSCGRILF